ncbi:hypothetical protein C8R47DRAFT_804208 [Mycena vitilis]|nr:hypothetical protein C8R47DRAFT_804208 [Mycena vitilis]
MLATLEADRARVAEIQTQIAQLERAVAQLRVQQSKVQERLDAYTYPVLTLHYELVSEIFVRVLPPYPDFPDLVGRFSPAPLSHICQRWRETASATPGLWRAISTSENPLEKQWELDAFDLWLKRSRHSPLSIRIGSNTSWAKDALVKAVVPHQARFEYPEMLNLPYTDARRIFDDSMPLLKHLEFADVVIGPHRTTFALLEVPRLRTVVLNGVAALNWIILPWNQLTSLTLPAVHPWRCVPILGQTRNLVHCELRVHYWRGDADPQQDIQLPFLESLAFADLGGRSMIDFLQSFTVPALRSLNIPEFYLTNSDPIDSLTAFMSRSGRGLEKLHLTDAISGPENFEFYRHPFSSLELSFAEEMYTDDQDLW